MTVDSEGVVTAHLNRDSHLTVGNAVEIVCKVNSDLSVKVLKSTDMGTSLGMSALCVFDEGETSREGMDMD